MFSDDGISVSVSDYMSNVLDLGKRRYNSQAGPPQKLTGLKRHEGQPGTKTSGHCTIYCEPDTPFSLCVKFSADFKLYSSNGVLITIATRRQDRTILHEEHFGIKAARVHGPGHVFEKWTDLRPKERGYYIAGPHMMFPSVHDGLNFASEDQPHSWSNDPVYSSISVCIERVKITAGPEEDPRLYSEPPFCSLMRDNSCSYRLARPDWFTPLKGKNATACFFAYRNMLPPWVRKLPEPDEEVGRSAEADAAPGDGSTASRNEEISQSRVRGVATSGDDQGPVKSSVARKASAGSSTIVAHRKRPASPLGEAQRSVRSRTPLANSCEDEDVRPAIPHPNVVANPCEDEDVHSATLQPSALADSCEGEDPHSAPPQPYAASDMQRLSSSTHTSSLPPGYVRAIDTARAPSDVVLNSCEDEKPYSAAPRSSSGTQEPTPPPEPAQSTEIARAPNDIPVRSCEVDSMYSATPRPGVVPGAQRSSLGTQEPAPPPEHARVEDTAHGLCSRQWTETSTLNHERVVDLTADTDTTSSHGEYVSAIQSQRVSAIRSEPASAIQSEPALAQENQEDDVEDLEDQLKVIELRRRIRAAKKRQAARAG